MLADAGVDVVFFDCTNGDITWKDSYEALMKTWDKAQKDGVNVPKIAFMLPFFSCFLFHCPLCVSCIVMSTSRDVIRIYGLCGRVSLVSWPIRII
ncbi:MAG: hypothetical protein LKE55_07225 [Prevotella sp.]|nr:hypothetical protein [Prevotella sp.]